jgi:hypothetical protein
MREKANAIADIKEPSAAWVNRAERKDRAQDRNGNPC